MELSACGHLMNCSITPVHTRQNLSQMHSTFALLFLSQFNCVLSDPTCGCLKKKTPTSPLDLSQEEGAFFSIAQCEITTNWVTQVVSQTEFIIEIQDKEKVKLVIDNSLSLSLSLVLCMSIYQKCHV